MEPIKKKVGIPNNRQDSLASTARVSTFAHASHGDKNTLKGILHDKGTVAVRNSQVIQLGVSTDASRPDAGNWGFQLPILFCILKEATKGG